MSGWGTEAIERAAAQTWREVWSDARPYAEATEAEKDECRSSARSILEAAKHRAICPTTYGEACDGYCAPAGDGGLREALEQHAEVWSTTGGPLGVSYATRVRDLLAAHPAAPATFDDHEPDDCRWPDTLGRCPHWAERRAAPAVPQPAKMEHLAKVLEAELRRQGADEFYDVPRFARQLVDAQVATGIPAAHAANAHNHPPRCCCASLDMGASYAPDDDYCSGCVVHGEQEQVEP